MEKKLFQKSKIASKSELLILQEAITLVFFIQRTNSYLVWRQKTIIIAQTRKIEQSSVSEIFDIGILGIDRSSQFAGIALKWAYFHHQPNYTTDHFFTAGKKTL